MSQHLDDTSSTTSSSTSLSTNSSQTTHKFMKTFKNLFEIFDPQSRGYINLNELESLGANQNEILNDIIKYVRTSDEFILKHHAQSTTINKSTNRPTKKQELHITFDSFVKAADVVIKKRKINKTNVSQKMQKTLSEEFSEPKHVLEDINCKLKKHDSFRFQANSCDLTKLIDEENSLLKLGISNVDKLKQVFENKLIHNQIKLANNLKLKHQNLFSIDKMLINLRELNNVNKLMGDYWTKSSLDASSNSSSSNALKLSNDLLLDNEHDESLLKIYDKTLKEKQTRISNLQKEKSLLIRKIFEMKSLTNSSNAKNDDNANLVDSLRGNQAINAKKQEDYLFD